MFVAGSQLLFPGFFVEKGLKWGVNRELIGRR
jgi:hypothetical protein